MYQAVLTADILILAMGMAAVYLGGGLWIGKVGYFFGLLAIAALAILVGNLAYQRARRGEVECHGPEYYIRYQPVDRFTFELARISEKEKFFPKDENKRPLPCTPARAKALQDVLTYLPYVERLEHRRGTFD